MRLANANYNEAKEIFLTICTKERRCILSQVVGTGVLDGPRIQLTKYGEIANKYIKQLNDFYDHISIERYVIMPNHIHLLVRVKERKDGPSGAPAPADEIVWGCGPSGTPVPTIQNSTVSKFVSTFKRFCNKECGENIWQYRSYDHIIRDREDHEEHVKYIHENPIRWYHDELYADE